MPYPIPIPLAPPSNPEKSWKFLRRIPRLSSMGNSSGLRAVGGLGEPSTGSSTHRRAGKALQAREATVSLQSPLASLSSLSFVTSGALRALGTRQTDTGWVRSGWPCLNHESRIPGHLLPAPRPLQPAPVRDSFVQMLTGIPRAPAGPAGPMGPCAPCEERGEQRQSQAGTGPASSASAIGLGWAPWYSPLLLGLPACQLGRRGQESQGAQGLQEHPGDRSHHDRPARREGSGSEKNVPKEARKEDAKLGPQPTPPADLLGPATVLQVPLPTETPDTHLDSSCTISARGAVGARASLGRGKRCR